MDLLLIPGWNKRNEAPVVCNCLIQAAKTFVGQAPLFAGYQIHIFTCFLRCGFSFEPGGHLPIPPGIFFPNTALVK